MRREWEHEAGRSGADILAVSASIKRANHVLNMLTAEALEPLNLSLAQYLTLGILSRSPKGILSIGAISDRLQVRQTSTTGMVNRLEDRGLVRRVRSESDGRVVLAEILRPGRALVRRATRIVATDGLNKVPWSLSELDTLYTMLAKLRESVGDFEESNSKKPATIGWPTRER